MGPLREVEKLDAIGQSSQVNINLVNNLHTRNCSFEELLDVHR